MSFVQTKTLSCLDNDDLSSNPLFVKGTVTEIVSEAKKQIYADYCIDENTLHEFSCDTDSGKKTDSEHSCANFNKTCHYGRCTSDW